MDWGLIIWSVSTSTWVVLNLWASLKGAIGAGKYITLPMVLIWARWKGKRTIKQKIRQGITKGDFEIHMTGPKFRWMQTQPMWALMLAGVVVQLSGYHRVSPVYCCVVFYWPYSALLADDLISTIDKDKWKKRWSKAKNKIKWKMVIPAPIPTR